MKKLFLILAAILMASTELWAQTQNVSYIDANGQSQSVDATEVTNSTTTLEAGWYVVNGSDVQTGSLTCSGAVNLILADGAKLTATGGDEIQAGIHVSGTGNSLTIYGQTAQNGQLIAEGNAGAGIGGNGEGDDGSNITINGGRVTAHSLNGGAGIGGGSFGNGHDITINGGTVTAIGFVASGIGGENGGFSSDIFVATTLIVKTVAIDNSITVIENTGSDLASSLAGKQYVTIEPAPALTTYIDADGVSHEINAMEVESSDDAVTWDAGWYVVTGTNVTLSKGAICNGAVNLILADGAKLTATGITDVPNDIYTPGIQVSDGNTFTIYGQTAQCGQLEANGGKLAAGIGGGFNGSGSNITINGGTVTANGGTGAAGIGGGYNGSGSNITINSGMVTANGRSSSAGIGGGYNGSGSNITINSGMVTAIGNGGAGIGGGTSGDGSYITINGGTITANGESSSAGIGGGNGGAGSNITINDGVVTAIGTGGAGIGGGLRGDGSYITINGGTVTATSNSNGSGIGGGVMAYGHDITINGGRVTATGGYHASGIGSGNTGGGAIALGSMIFVSTNLIVTADVINPPITIIAAYRTATTDIANDLVGKQYVVIELNPLPDAKAAAIAAINAAISETDPDDIKAIATNAVAAIETATTVDEVNTIKALALAAIATAKAAFAAGLGSLAEPCEECPAVEVKKGDKTVILYGPESVTFKKTE